MKNTIKKILVILTIILSTSVIFNFTAPSAYGAPPREIHLDEEDDSGGGGGGGGTTHVNCRYFLGMPSWDCDVNTEPANEEEITSNILRICSNIFTSITVASAYLVLGFVIYGGYLYMFSSGDAGKAANSRKVLTRAFIGLAIVLLSNVILNAIRFALIRNDSLTINSSVDASEVFVNCINWIIGIAGAVAIIFVIIGAIGYITSAGDPSKLQKAKNTLLYALIGLAIVGLSATITAVVSGIIRDAENTGFINQTLIAKELHEK